LVALVDAAPRKPETNSLEAHIREKETQLRELQHRVKNNLQMITSLIRLETRNAEIGKQDGFMRLAGRVSSLAFSTTHIRFLMMTLILTWECT